jgi:hypothetical protein
MAAWVSAVRWEIKRNADLIAANGSLDTLHEGFHRLRSFYRIMAALLIAAVASLPAWRCDPAMGVSMVALQVLFAGWFTWKFNPALNLARGKHEYYASLDPHAALFPDRLAVAVARRASAEHGEPLGNYLAPAYEAILRITYGASIAAYVLLMAWAVYLLIH